MGFKILPQALGEDILEGLIKSHVYKPETNTSLNLDEVALAYKIVPKAVLTWVIVEFKQMNTGGVMELHIPFKIGYRVNVNKHAPDNYAGEVYFNGSVATKFNNKSLAGISLVIMSALELYDVPKEDKEQKGFDQSDVFSVNDKLIDAKINSIVMEKLLMQSMISGIVDKTIRERDAIKRLIELREKEQENEEINESVVSEEAEEEIKDNNNKDSINKLKAFLVKKSKEKIQTIHSIDKSNSLSCPDCETVLYKSGESHITCCICFGSFMDKQFKFSKKENAIKFDFPISFDKENINMLLDAIKQKKINKKNN